MSWDVLLQRFPAGTASPEDVPDAYLPPPVGSRAEVIATLRKLLRNVGVSGSSQVVVERAQFAIEIDLGDQDPCSQLLLNVHDDHGEASKTIVRIADRFGMRAIDCSSGEFLEAPCPSQPNEMPWAKAPPARRKPVQRASTPPSPPLPLTALPGVIMTQPCVRYIYLSLLPSESPKQQQNAVYRQYLELLRAHPDLNGGVMVPSSLLTLPGGEAFGDFRVARYPTQVAETEAAMIPRVQKMAKLLHDYAAAARRLSGEIEKGSTFACGDGRRIPLAECTFGKLLTDADYARKVTRRPRT